MRYTQANIFMCQALLCEAVQRNMRCPALVGKTQNAWVKYGLKEKEKECVSIFQTPWHHFLSQKSRKCDARCQKGRMENIEIS